MIHLRAIRYRLKPDDSHEIWKFEDGRVATTFVYSFQESIETQQILKDVFDFLFGDSNKRQIADAAIQLRDESNCIWTLERVGNEIRFHRNGKRLNPSGAEAQILASMLDFDLQRIESDDFPRRNARAFGSFELCLGGDGQPTLQYQCNEEEVQGKLSQVFVKKYEEIKTRIGKSLNFDPGFDKVFDILEARAEQITSYLDRYREYSTLPVRDEKQMDLSERDLNYYKKLKCEVEILEDLELQAAPLLENLGMRKKLSSELNNAKDEIDAIFASLGLTAEVLNVPAAQWTNLIDERSKLNGLRSFNKQLDLVEKGLFANTKMTLSDFNATLRELIASDSEITGELEKCLAQLHANLLEIQPRKKTGLSKWLDFKVLKNKSKTSDFGRIYRKNLLENSKLAIDFALGRLGELHCDVDTLKDKEKAWTGCVERNLADFKNLLNRKEEQWVKTCAHYGIGSDLSLDKLFALCAISSRLKFLEEEVKLAQERLNQYDQRLELISQIYKGWMTQSHSQHSDGPFEPGVLLNAVKRTLNFLSGKRSQLLRYESMQQQRQIELDLEVKRTKGIVDLHKAWNDLLEDVPVQLPELGSKSWKVALPAIFLLKFWREDVVDPRGSFLTAEDKIKNPHSRPLICLLTVPGFFLEGEGSIFLQNLLLEMSGSAVIVCSSPSKESGYLKQKAIGRAVKVINKTKSIALERRPSDPLEVFRQARLSRLQSKEAS